MQEKESASEFSPEAKEALRQEKALEKEEALKEEIALKKEEALKAVIRDMGSVAVAFSGGVDSTYLLAVAHEVLGHRAIAITASSASFPEREQNEAAAFCEVNGIRQITAASNELDVPGYRENPKNRCYLCKKALFSELLAIAAAEEIAFVAEGSNMDDLGDYRPGLEAVKELGIRSPLREAELSKAEIRQLSKLRNLPTWDKPSFACLASRFVYGETIDEEKLGMVGKAEQCLMDLGFRQVRVRIHGKMARIELPPQDIATVATPEIRETIVRTFKEIGFTYISLDLMGYRTGSMNEVL